MYRESNGVWAGMVLAVALLGAAPQPHPGVASTVNVKLSEWNVVLSQASVAAGPAAPAPSRYGASEMSEAHTRAERVQAIRVTGGGPVIQILPGPFPFPDSAAPILKAFGDEREGLESQVKNGPYSNNVVRTSGSFAFTA